MRTDRPIYVHRRGSNSVTGEYYWDYSNENTLGHYSGKRDVDIDGMRERLATLMESDPEEVPSDSPLMGGGEPSIHLRVEVAHRPGAFIGLGPQS